MEAKAATATAIATPPLHTTLRGENNNSSIIIATMIIILLGANIIIIMK
jgi:hypothetical protein